MTIHLPRRLPLLLGVLLLPALLASCSTKAFDPRGIGSGLDDLNSTNGPCACSPVAQQWG